MLDRLSGFSTNVFKLEPQGSNTAGPNNIIRITLPANSLVNFRTFALHFDAQTLGGVCARLPNKIDSLIERVEVTFGGVQVAAGNNYYSVLRHAKDALMGDKCDPVLGHKEINRAISNETGLALVADEAAAKYCINKWEGFLGTVEPQIVDLSLLPECVVSIYLTSNYVLTKSVGPSDAADFQNAGPSTPNRATFLLQNIYATIETVGMSDGTYDAMVSQIMSRVGFLELPFKQYVSFRDRNANTRFSVATQSLDRLWLVHHSANHTAEGAPILVTGYFNADAVQGFIGSEYSGEKYISNAFNFPQNDADAEYQLQLNGAMIPQYRAKFEDMMQISRQSIEGSPQDKHVLKTMKDNYAVFCVRLNLQNSERLRQISGLDTRGIALNGIYNITGYDNTKDISIFAEVTSVLRVGSGLQLEVIS